MRGKTSWTFALGLLGLIASLTIGASENAPATESCVFDDRKAFGLLKSLAGEWEGTANEARIAVTYRVTAGGSVLMETLFAGTDHEMVSMYHLDGDDLVLTHYCAMGNQPRMRFDTSVSTPRQLKFAFDGGTNVVPDKDTHVHSGQINRISDDRLESEWTVFTGGKAAGSHAFVITRRGR